MFGFDLAERLSGTFYFHAEARRERAIRITLALRASGLRRFARERTLSASGTIVADDLAGERARDGEEDEAARPIWGEVRWKLLDQKRVPYDLAFDGNDGRRYLLRGQRDFFVHDVAGSMATMAASLYVTTLTKPAREDGERGEGGREGREGEEGLEGEEEVGRAVLAFEPRIELPALLRSFRPRLSRG